MAKLWHYLAEINKRGEKSTRLSRAFAIIIKKYIKISKKAVTHTVIVKAQHCAIDMGAMMPQKPNIKNSKTARNKYLKTFIVRALN